MVAAVSEVSARLMDATAVALKGQERESELLQRVNELERELATLKRAHDLSANYVLHKFETGALAYAQREEVTDTPSHYLCAKCSDEGVHSKLQPHGNYQLECHTCKSKISHKFTPPPQPLRVSRI
jgi:DNA-directed RNA polymerase subunit RPC12/RpoP